MSTESDAEWEAQAIADAMYETEQAYWASPEGVERQLAEWRAYVAAGHYVGGDT